MIVMNGRQKRVGGLVCLVGLSVLLLAGSGCDSATPVNPLENVIVVLQDTISVSRTLVPDSTYILRGTVVVSALPGETVEPTLTIQPGTVILGEKSSRGMLVIGKQGYIDAQGSYSSPIVFSSDQAVGSRAPGDWGGIVINGDAPTNDGFMYGGTNSEDSSGTLKYVRIEFAGGEGTLAGLTLFGVGRGTHIDFLQVHRCDKIAVDLIGGNLSLHYLLVTQPADLGVSWDNGWTGEGQYWIIQAGSGRGIHGSNYSSDVAAVPRSAPMLYNLTLVAEGGSVGVEWAGGTAGVLANSIVQGFQTAFKLNDTYTVPQIVDSTLVVSHSIVYDCDTLALTDNIPANVFDTSTWLTDSSSVIRRSDPKLTDPFSLDAPDFIPSQGSPANQSDSLAGIPAEAVTLEPAGFAGAEQRYYFLWVPADWTAFPRN